MNELGLLLALLESLCQIITSAALVVIAFKISRRKGSA